MLNSLQACRAFACLIVVLYHSATIFSQPKYFGVRPFGAAINGFTNGLDLLLVLSGFIILFVHRPDLGKPRSFVSYLHRRFHRLMPTYWVVLACLVPMFFLVPSFGDGSQRDLGVILRSVFLIPQPTGDAILGVSWTMSLEVLFYLVFSLLVVNRGLGIVVFAGWACLLWAKPWPGQYPLGFLHSSYFTPILGGMVACEILHRVRIPKPVWWAVLGTATFVGVLVFEAFRIPHDFITKQLVVTAGVMMLLIGLAALDQAGRIKVPRFVCILGDASYSIYLVHYPALSVICKLVKSARLNERINAELLCVGMFVGAIAAGLVFARVVELPLRRWRQPKRPTDQAPQQTQTLRRAA